MRFWFIYRTFEEADLRISQDEEVAFRQSLQRGSADSLSSCTPEAQRHFSNICFSSYVVWMITIRRSRSYSWYSSRFMCCSLRNLIVVKLNMMRCNVTGANCMYDPEVCVYWTCPPRHLDAGYWRAAQEHAKWADAIAYLAAFSPPAQVGALPYWIKCQLTIVFISWNTFQDQ